MNRATPLTRTLAAAAIAVTTGAAFGFSGGAPEGFTGSPASGGLSCVLCHASFELNSGPGSITILDLPDRYVPDQTYTLRVRIEDAGKVGAGFELSVESPAGAHLGSLAVADAINTQSAGGPTPTYLTHTSDGKANAISNWGALSAAAEFTIDWTAPSTDEGEIGFYAAGVAINNGTASSNDNAYTTAPVRSAAGLGDLNGDGFVDAADLGLMIRSFGTADPVADLDNDSLVDSADLGLLLSVFGTE